MRRIAKLLVANRGEIAIRIFRACRELGIVSAAIYSEADRDALHLSFADEAYLVGEAAAAASYLNIGRILEIARAAGADAVHPGYGFLAENPRFADAVVEAGLIWIGPPPQAIEATGDKTEARRTAASVGVESVPGTLEAITGPGAIEAFAAQHGWPVAVKAARGGGGRGFRVAKGAEEAPEAFEAAAREAQLAFGSPKLYLERYLETPRHIEIQILGDAHGNLIHLGERECSLQRRHQKLIEESPSPIMEKSLRARMGAAALEVARAAGYQSAGTVEFLLEETAEGPRFWFLELNSRLQVEHPVTEEVIGCDLVKEMIRVAEGARLSLTQDDVHLRGHAIECRINAENPAQGFLPSPGAIGAYREPAGPGVRVDSGVTAGSSIPETYDSLIAKLIVTGSDREEAIRRMLRALDEFQIEDVHTTIPFHRHVMGSEWFLKGRFSTKTVERLDLSRLPLRAPRKHPESPRLPGSAHRQEREMTVEIEGKRFGVRFTERLDGRPDRLKPKPPDPGRRTARGASEETITAPMQGTIVKTLKAEGDRVTEGEPILVLEAMKMENLILSRRDGQILALRVKAGDSVERGAVLAEIGLPE